MTEQFPFGGMKINTPLINAVDRRLSVIFYVSCQFEIIEMIRLTMKPGINSSIISIVTELRTDAIRKNR